MSSSISSSEPFWPKPLLLLAAILGIGGWKLVRLEDHFADFANEKAFWAKRVSDPKRYDILFLGDSRTYRGIVVSAMANDDALAPDLRIGNKGFSGAGLREPYLRWGAGLLDDAGPRILVIGVTVNSLSENPSAKGNEHFVESSRPDVYRGMLFLQQFFHRRTTYGAFTGTVPRCDERNRFHPGGWVEVILSGPQIERPGLGFFRDGLSRFPVTDVAVSEFMQCVSMFERSGVRVIAFRPPASRNLEELEDSFGYLDFDALRGRLRGVGVEWIEPEERWSYETYDESHLHPEAAMRLSRDLARRLKDLIDGKVTVSRTP